MEIINFIWKSPWEILLILIGLVLIFTGFKIFLKEQRLKKTGIKTIATVIAFSYEKSIEEDRPQPPVKIPVFIFSDHLNNKFSVKGKSNSICEIYETTPIYYNPAKPETEYYLPNKDFMVKHLFFFFGLALLCFGLYYLHQHSIEYNPFLK